MGQYLTTQQQPTEEGPQEDLDVSGLLESISHVTEDRGIPIDDASWILRTYLLGRWDGSRLGTDCISGKIDLAEATFPEPVKFAKDILVPCLTKEERALETYALSLVYLHITGNGVDRWRSIFSNEIPSFEKAREFIEKTLTMQVPAPR